MEINNFLSNYKLHGIKRLNYKFSRTGGERNIKVKNFSESGMGKLYKIGFGYNCRTLRRRSETPPNREEASGGQTDPSDNCIPPWPVGKKTNGERSTWTNGRPYSAPFWVGYRNGNQITRMGMSLQTVHNLTQNMVHKFMSTPYYMSYDEFRGGGYFYTGYRNPLSLWDR